MDFFCETIVRRKKGAKEYILALAMVVMLVAIVSAAFMLIKILGGFFLLAIAGIIYLFYIGITSLNIEYEYALTNGELDIDKITARRKRKRILTVNSSLFEYFAPMTKEHIQRYNDASVEKRFDFTSNTGSDGVYFAIFRTDGVKTCITFEPNERMLEEFSRTVRINRSL
ncbi:MAG: hypothetical protein BWY15_01870 [Firmicutes bacterium ADurb.Bin193]|nr:MAG: hypothetical protein BWY15_01870 [Firmicutes bacterium ADurb.Bin193]